MGNMYMTGNTHFDPVRLWTCWRTATDKHIRLIHRKGVSYMKYAPAVFTVGREYQIMTFSDGPSLMWVEVAGQKYYDESNGILRANAPVHRAHVPMEALDAAGEYTVYLRKVVESRPYFPVVGPEQAYTYSFRPVKSGENIRAYHIADAHNRVKGPLAAAKAFGDIDFLILNGDVPDHSGSPDRWESLYEIAGEIGKGNIPIVFARGNHDMRGFCAENFADNTPTDRGNVYYTFRLGDIWGMVLDCGEDKPDDHPEYGGTTCCHAFRKRETEFIRDVIRRAGEEYLSEGVKTRIVVCHNPFFYRCEPPFDIEEEIFAEWSRLLREFVHPDLLIHGHMHYLKIVRPGDADDHRGQSCPAVIGSDIKGDEYYAGAGFVFSSKEIRVCFTDDQGHMLTDEIL